VSKHELNFIVFNVRSEIFRGVSDYALLNAVCTVCLFQ
jgi:hypothetical protein